MLSLVHEIHIYHHGPDGGVNVVRQMLRPQSVTQKRRAATSLPEQIRKGTSNFGMDFSSEKPYAQLQLTSALRL